jgi:hypothetical protein
LLWSLNNLFLNSGNGKSFLPCLKKWFMLLHITIPKYKFVVTVLILPHCLSNLLVSNKICWCRRG